MPKADTVCHTLWGWCRAGLLCKEGSRLFSAKQSQGNSCVSRSSMSFIWFFKEVISGVWSKCCFQILFYIHGDLSVNLLGFYMHTMLVWSKAGLISSLINLSAGMAFWRIQSTSCYLGISYQEPWQIGPYYLPVVEEAEQTVPCWKHLHEAEARVLTGDIPFTLLSIPLV